MEDNTSTFKKQADGSLSSNESKLWGVSIRGWIVCMVMGTACFREIVIVIHAMVQNQPIEQVKEPFYGVVMGLIGFYFGQKTTTSTPNQPTTK